MLSAENYLCVVQSRGQRGLPLERVYRNMRNRDLFLMAYGKIYANKGATTLGTDPTDTIQGMSLARIDKIIEQLRNGTYQWKPSRRKYILKKNGKMRPLSVPNWTDKLVQEVLRMILEAYYEPQFRNNSHGFRPRRSCHTALDQIKYQWKGTKWFIEGDIKGCFCNISHQKLLDLLSLRIHDQRLLKLIRGMLKAGYFEDWVYHRSFSGTPQGGIISPLMSNIMLHELDCFVEDIIIPQYSKNKRRKQNQAYTKLAYLRQKARQSNDVELYKRLTKAQRTISSVDTDDPNYRRLRYVRYADDFLLGFIGPKSEAITIKEQISCFLQGISLEMSEEKTFITHASTQKARFLGYHIQTRKCNTKLTSLPSGAKIRSINGSIELQVPSDVRTKWISRYTRADKTHQIGAYIELSDFEIVNTYGAQLRGLVNYYSMADNIGTALRYVRWVCMESTRKTLAAKHRIKSPSTSHKRYRHKGGTTEKGKLEWQHIRVTIQRKGKKPLIAKCAETPLRTRKTVYSSDKIPPTFIMGTRSELTIRLVKEKCELCGIKAALEAHHVNKLKNLKQKWKGRKSKPKWVQWMIARNRKVIVVCHSCHQSITHGRYDKQKVE